MTDIQSVILFRLGKKQKSIDTQVVIYLLDNMDFMMFTPVPGSGAVHDRPGRRQRRGTPPAACQKYKEERPGNRRRRRMEVSELLGTWTILRHRETLGELGDKKNYRRRGERRRPDGAVGTRDLCHGR